MNTKIKKKIEINQEKSKQLHHAMLKNPLVKIETKDEKNIHQLFQYSLLGDIHDIKTTFSDKNVSESSSNDFTSLYLFPTITRYPTTRYERKHHIINLLNNNGINKTEKINKIINVYQAFYKNNVKATGFGDYLRGCYFLLEYGLEKNIIIDFVIQHPLQNVLKNENQNLNLISQIESFQENGIQSVKFVKDDLFEHFHKKEKMNECFEDYMKNQPKWNNEVFVYTICIPKRMVSRELKKRIKILLLPNQEMNNYIFVKMNELKLKKKQYRTIHIRCGDDYLFHKNENKIDFFQNIKKKILKWKLNMEKKEELILLLCDNNEIKKYLSSEFSQFKSFETQITHLGEFVHSSEEIKNTMLDFYLLSYSKTITCLSIYDHGSGFSMWCAVTYDIPYQFIKI
jgi:hypothetical protein